MNTAFEGGSGGVDPASIPQRRLYTGATMPAIGLGTFGSDHVSASQVADAVKGAAAVGYRHFDCASVYGNEAAVGASLAAPTEDPVIVKIAEKHGIHPAVVCIKWAVKRGQIPIPFSVNPRNYLANLQGAAGDPLTDEEMNQIAGIDRNCRLIKGQVFLWKADQSWEDLWDINGEITPP